MDSSLTRSAPVAPPYVDDAAPRRRAGARRHAARDPFGRRLLRAVGWLFLFAGAIVLLYLVYSLFFTNLQTEAEQSELLEQWELDVGAVEAAAPPPAEAAPPPAAPIDPGSALAVLQFSRPGSGEAVVSEQPLFVVNGVSVPDLQRGPGHYPDTALPGAPGNFAVAGHRTTYGAPFYHLDQLVPGDEIAVTDRAGSRFVYRVVEQRIVAPSDGSVIGPDPLGRGRPLLTLTTCHPRFSNAQRMIVFAELVA
jgi:sortase A